MSIPFDENLPYSCEWGFGGPQSYEQDGRKYDVKKQFIQPVDAPVAYADMHWKELKRLVEEKGGVWTDKVAALAFLTQE